MYVLGLFLCSCLCIGHWLTQCHIEAKVYVNHYRNISVTLESAKYLKTVSDNQLKLTCSLKCFHLEATQGHGKCIGLTISRLIINRKTSQFGFISRLVCQLS